MTPAHRHAWGLGHSPAARPPDLISHHQGETGAAGQRGASSGCSTAARSCPRSPTPGGQAAGPGRQSGDDPGAPPRPGTWPWSSSAPPVTPARQRRRPTEHLKRLQHCAARSCPRSPPGGQAAGPGRQSGDQLGNVAGRQNTSSGCSTAARSCLRSPAPGARPPDRAAHQVMAPACRPARGHGPAARQPDQISHHRGEVGVG